MCCPVQSRGHCHSRVWEFSSCRGGSSLHGRTHCNAVAKRRGRQREHSRKKRKHQEQVMRASVFTLNSVNNCGRKAGQHTSTVSSAESTSVGSRPDQNSESESSSVGASERLLLTSATCWLMSLSTSCLSTSPRPSERFSVTTVAAPLGCWDEQSPPPQRDSWDC